MKVASLSNHSQTTDFLAKKRNDTSFKSSAGMSLLTGAGALMQGIENKGYWVSFLIQDGLGMTFPRTLTGLYRDKDITGEYNFKEAAEVGGREGSTGPYLIGVAPFMIWATSKYCKTAGTNTRLIKALGDNFKELLDSPKFTQELKKNKEMFKKEFSRYNLEKFYKDTIPNDKKPEETVEYILQELKKLDSKDSKVNKEGLNNILEKLNEKIISTSSDLDSLCRLSITSNGKKTTYKADEVIKAVHGFGTDAIDRNPNFSEIDKNAAENIKNNFATKRLAFNVGSVALTLGGLSVLPSLYAWNSVAPGAQGMVNKLEEQKKQNDSRKDNAKSSEVSFKGKGINSENLVSKFGKFITKKVPSWIQREFEYDGINFTPSLMACLSIFGLIVPRGRRAYKRAYVDEQGNRDWSEVKEIMVRDPISSLAVVFTVPILQKVIVNAYESKQGFVLTNRASKDKNKFHKFLDVINPYSDLHVFKNTELEALYDKITNKEKMINFINYIDKKGGDLEKILSKSTKASEVFNEKTFTLDSIKEKSVGEKNKQIKEFFEKLADNAETNGIIKKLMKDNGELNQSTISKIARGLNSIPGFLVTAVISPIILGVLIPMLTYSNTRKAHEKMTSGIQDNEQTKVA